eukprot:s52_g2.t1
MYSDPGRAAQEQDHASLQPACLVREEASGCPERSSSDERAPRRPANAGSSWHMASQMKSLIVAWRQHSETLPRARRSRIFSRRLAALSASPRSWDADMLGRLSSSKHGKAMGRI